MQGMEDSIKMNTLLRYQSQFLELVVEFISKQPNLCIFVGDVGQ
jgi:hypothetical protein